MNPVQCPTKSVIRNYNQNLEKLRSSQVQAGVWTLVLAIAGIYCLVTLHGAEDAMAARFYHIGGLPPRVSTTSSVQNFQGRLQGLVINGERILDEAHLKQIDYEGREECSGG